MTSSPSGDASRPLFAATDNPFLREVIEHPDDDDVRLIYADYLEEQGDPRGEFIRVQCELARASTLDPRHEDLFERSSELLMEHRDRWAAELMQDVKKIEFQRGFISTITILARRLAAQGKQIFRETPVQWVRLNRVGGAGAKVAACPILRRVRRLDLSSLKIPLEDLTPLLTSPHLDNLVALNIDGMRTQWNEDLGAALVSMASAAKLESLSMRSESNVPPSFIEALTSGPGFPSLRELCFGVYYGQVRQWRGIGTLAAPALQSLKVRGTLNADGCRDLAQLPVAQLRCLDLRGSRAPASGLKAIAANGGFDRVEKLNLTNCAVAVRACEALFCGDHLRHCRNLSLGDNDSAARHANNQVLLRALESHPLPSLQQLEIRCLNFEQLGALARNPQLHDLQSIAAPHSYLSVEDFAALALSPWTKTMRGLDFRDCAIEPTAGRVLMEAEPVFEQLLRLDLSGHSSYDTFGSTIGDDKVLPWLCCGLPALQYLRLAWSQVTDETLDALAVADLPELRKVEIIGSSMSPRAVQRMLESPLLPKLQRLTLSAIHNRKLTGCDFDGRLALV